MPAAMTSAATPATCGDAIDVPLPSLYQSPSKKIGCGLCGLSASFQVESTDTPGAASSISSPVLDQLGLVSFLSVAATAITEAYFAG